jgi:hypothetical protein
MRQRQENSRTLAGKTLPARPPRPARHLGDTMISRETSRKSRKRPTRLAITHIYEHLRRHRMRAEWPNVNRRVAVHVAPPIRDTDLRPLNLGIAA